MAFHDYESLAYSLARARVPALIESYRGKDIVGWQGRIERQLKRFVDENDEARNYAYADKLREFLKIWRANVLDGSINVETVVALTTPSEVLAVDTWRYQDYFSNLRDQLRQLRASVEELPVGDELAAAERGPGTGEAPDGFGPREEPPGQAPQGATPTAAEPQSA